MSKISILSCASCGASLTPKALQCSYCNNVNVISQEKSHYKINSELTKSYLSNGQFLKDNYSTALLHLNLQNYAISTKMLENEINQNPINAEAYYYMVLGLIGGKRIKSLPFSSIKKIKSYLEIAIDLEEHSKYYYLAAIINYDFYFSNGMLLPEPNYNLLLEKSNELAMEHEDIEYLKSIIQIPKTEIFNLTIKT